MVFRAIPLPVQQVLQPLPAPACLNNTSDRIGGMTIFDLGDVEHGMYAPGVRKLQLNSCWIDDSLDLIWADEARSQFAGRYSQRDVYSGNHTFCQGR